MSCPRMFKATVLLLSLIRLAPAEDWIAECHPPAVQGEPHAVFIDAQGNRYLCGEFEDPSDFNPGIGVDFHMVNAAGSSTNYDNAFVTKLNADGSYAWTQSFGGAYDDYATALVVADGIVYVTGAFIFSADLGGVGFGGVGSVTGVSFLDVFVLALDASTGAPVPTFGTAGVQVFGGSSLDLGQSIAVRNGVVYVGGIFSSSNAGFGRAGSITTIGSSDAFVFALDAVTGQPVNSFGAGGVKALGGAFADSGAGIAFSDSVLYVTGSFAAAEFAEPDIFVAALDAATGAELAGFGSAGMQKFGGASADIGTVIAVSGGVVYAGGTFASANAGFNGPGNISTTGANDVFILALNAATGAPVAGFGNGGVQIFGGSDYETCGNLAVGDGSLFVTGSFASVNAGVGGSGSVASLGYSDAFVLALDAATGLPKSQFASGGVQTLSGTSSELGYGVVVKDSVLYITGEAMSNDSGVGGIGGFYFDDNGYLLELDPITGATLFPLFNLPVQATGLLNEPFSFVLTASGNPVSFDATGLPAGLALNGDTISGVATTPGRFYAHVSATNSHGTTTASLYVRVMEDKIADSYPPVIQGNAAAVAFDSEGNRYVAGRFYDAGDFNPGAGADIQTTIDSENAYVTKFGAGGEYLWTQTFGGHGGAQGTKLAVADGVVYLAGDFYGTRAGVGGAGGIDAVGIIYYDTFIVALDAGTGAAKPDFGRGGVQTFGGHGFEWVSGIAAANGTIFVTGTFDSADAGIGGPGNFRTSVYQDVYVLALAADTGAVVNAFGSGGVQTFGGNQNDQAGGICESGGALYVTGNFAGSSAGIGGPGTLAAFPGNSDAFVVALNSSTGQPLPGFVNGGVQIFGGYGQDLGTGVAVSGTNLYVCGSFSSNNAGIAGEGSLATTGNFDAFVIALDALTGAAHTGFGVQGTMKFGGSNYDYGVGLAVLNDTVYVAGEFSSTNAAIGAFGVLATAGRSDTFVVALDPRTGAQRVTFSDDGVQRFGGTSLDAAAGIAAHGTEVAVTGFFASNDAGIGGFGNFDATYFGGFLLTLDSDTGGLIDRPVAKNGTLAAQEDQSATGKLTAVDPTGDPLTFRIARTPGRGEVALNELTGDFSYTPAANEFGTDSFTFVANDGTKDSNEAVFTINIAPVNDPPVTADIALAVDGTARAMSQLPATDIDGDVLSFQIVTGPALGSVTLNPSTGEFTYASFDNVTAVDSFIFSVDDGSVTVSATVTLNISRENEAPIAIDSTLSVSGTAPLTSLLLANDPEGGPLTFAVVSNCARGTLQLNTASGVFTYTGNANVAAADSFTFKTSDGELESNVATVTLNIVHVNEPPAFTSGPGASPAQVYVGQTVAFSAAAADPENDALAYSWDFEDGGNASGANTQHSFAAAGTYLVEVAVNDGLLTTRATVGVVVLPAFEAAVTGGSVKFLFTAKDRDSFQLTGTIPLAKGLVLRGKQFQIEIVDFKVGGLIFDAKNTAVSGKTITFKIAAKMNKDGSLIVPPAPRFSLALKNASLFAAFESAGFVNDDVRKVAVPVTARFRIDNLPYDARKTFSYSAKRNKSGSGR